MFSDERLRTQSKQYLWWMGASSVAPRTCRLCCSLKQNSASPMVLASRNQSLHLQQSTFDYIYNISLKICSLASLQLTNTDQCVPVSHKWFLILCSGSCLINTGKMQNVMNCLPTDADFPTLFPATEHSLSLWSATWMNWSLGKLLQAAICSRLSNCLNSPLCF